MLVKDANNCFLDWETDNNIVSATHKTGPLRNHPIPNQNTVYLVRIGDGDIQEAPSPTMFFQKTITYGAFSYAS